MDQLAPLLDGWKRKKVVVVGDFMLDRYTYGNAERLSPDAPVPVLAVDKSKNRFEAGGAGNVCRDLAALQCKVAAVGIVGGDSDGQRLRDALRADGIHTAGLLTARGRPTTVKDNIIGLAQHRHPQKMFRLDTEDRSPIDDKLADRLLAAVRKQLRGAAALCIEDYNKGVLTPRLCAALIEAARAAGVPSLVDPAAIDDYAKYAGATCITPNRTEAELASGISATEGNEPALARKLLDAHRFEAVVLTLDRHGAMLLEKGGQPRHVPTVARAVYDVTGAGDMVLAMLAAALANGAELFDAVRLANVAAGLEVERFGVVPIALDEIIVAVAQNQHGAAGKMRSLEHLLPELRALRNLGKTIAFTNGCFDILHYGHVNYLREARRCADLLVVAINSDASVRRLKGPERPYSNEHDRAAVLAELECVDYLTVFDADTPVSLIKAIRPDVLVKGGDYKPSQVVGGDMVKAWGGVVRVVGHVKGKSTTNLVNHIRNNRKG